MDGSTPDTWQKDVTAAFEKKTGAKLKIEIQQWNGIQQKLTTALSEENPPDVFEVGNTQTPAYAKTGGLADLSDLKSSVGADWAESMNKSAVSDGKQYAAPWFVVNRVVIYNKKIWADSRHQGHPQDARRVLQGPPDHRQEDGRGADLPARAELVPLRRPDHR